MQNNLHRKYKILVIEDNEINREILNEILSEQYTLYFAENGKEGMEMLRKNYRIIDVILLDIQMPVMNGYEVLTEKAKEPLLKDIPVIVTTSSDGHDDEVKCLGLGAQDFIRKPYDPTVVLLRIESLIYLRESTEANRQKIMFIQSISHEIRTPMNVIIGFAEIIESMAESLSPEDLKKFCSNITSNSHLLIDMLTNMVNLSDFDSNFLTLSLGEVAPNKICRDAMKQASRYAPENVNVSFTSDVDDEFVFNSNKKYLKQAIYNLIVNAYKFTQQGEVRIHCSDKEMPGMIVFSVTDTGIGIPPEKSEEIFERFIKVDEFVPGLGLGLTIARAIAQNLNGSVYLDTTYTGGSRFVMELPLS